MATRLPDRLTVTQQVINNFREAGINPTPEQVVQATDDTMNQIRKNYFESLPVGYQMYEYEGKEDAAGFMKNLINTSGDLY